MFSDVTLGILASVNIARDILHEDFPRLRPDENLSESMDRFAGVPVERLPVIDHHGVLVGSLAKGDILLALVERQRKRAPS